MRRKLIVPRYGLGALSYNSLRHTQYLWRFHDISVICHYITMTFFPLLRQCRTCWLVCNAPSSSLKHVYTVYCIYKYSENASVAYRCAALSYSSYFASPIRVSPEKRRVRARGRRLRTLLFFCTITELILYQLYNNVGGKKESGGKKSSVVNDHEGVCMHFGDCIADCVVMKSCFSISIN